MIDGGDGDDSVYTGGGNDTLIGGPGQDYLDGGPGFDTADYYDSPQRVILRLADTDSWGVGEEPGTADQAARLSGGDAEGDTLQGIEKVATSQFDDLVFGFDTGTWADLWNGNDTFDNTQDMDAEDHIFGGYGNDRIWTGAGDDSLYGEWGNDLLFGEDGNDLLDGGSESDSLTGGNGADSIVGDAGNDTFVYNDVQQSAPALGFDKIYGFDNPGPAAGDVIDFSAIDPFSSTAQNEAFIWAGELSANPEAVKAQQQWGAV